MNVLEITVADLAPWLGPVILGVILGVGALAWWGGARLGRPGR